ncbi:trafficking protein particle complex subunit 12 [Sarotherodon galilaeus]
MKKAQSMSSPAKTETPSSKRYRPADSPGTTSPAGKDIVDILESIDKRLSSFDARLSLVEILHREFQSLKESLEFSQKQSAGEDPETTVRSFIKIHLKLPEDTVKNIGFERVHRIGAPKTGSGRPRPIVAKFGHFKQKEQVKSRGRELKGTDFSVNDQLPREILERRRVLFPVRRSFIQKGSRAVIAVDRLYVDGQLYRDPGITPWLY